MLPEAAGRGQHFQVRGHSFSLYGPTLSRQITYLFFSAINWLKIGFTQLCFYWIGLRAVYLRLQSIVRNLSNERASKLRNYTKKDVLKNRFISNCFMLVASNLPVKFSKSVFPIVKFLAKFDWSCTRNTISFSRFESLEIRPFYRELNRRKRGNSLSVFYRISLKYSSDQRG